MLIRGPVPTPYTTVLHSLWLTFRKRWRVSSLLLFISRAWDVLILLVFPHTIQYNIYLPYTTFTHGKKKWRKLMTENKWRENLKETTRLITSQAFSLKITNLILELQYGLMVINFDRAHVHTHTRTHILSKLVKNYCLTEANT